MKKILLSSAIILATTFVACEKNSDVILPAAGSGETTTAALAGSDEITTAARHGADDPGQPTTGIPQAVISGFQRRYPTATNVEYEKEVEHGTTTYKVKFVFKTKRWIAFFSANGTFISVEKK